MSPEGVLDLFFEEMEARHWSTSSRDVHDARAATMRRIQEDDHVHRYAPQPSGRGVGFDLECVDCGHIENRRPFV